MDTFSRSIHDLGLAAWFGGSLMGAIGLNGGAATAKDREERTAIASAGWAKWTPVNAAAIGAHLVGGAGVVIGNKGRMLGQKNVATTSIIKLAVTAAALGATAVGRLAGKKIEELSPQASSGVTEPSSSTSDELAQAQKQEKWAQWAIPLTTGILLIINSRMGEQQRTTSVVSGVTRRLHNSIS